MVERLPVKIGSFLEQFRMKNEVNSGKPTNNGQSRAKVALGDKV